MKVSALDIGSGAYRNHALHRDDNRAWLETNCYVDLWIELIHALKLDPVAALAFTVASDFEGDQWLFYKQPTGDLYDLYGIDAQELAIWRPLLEHSLEQLSRRRVVMVEVDAFHLPDTRGVSYQTEHAKTTIGIESLDPEARRAGYFHNAGYFELAGPDFDALFRPLSPGELAPYTEFAKFDQLSRLSDRELGERSLALFERHLQRIPRDNPFLRFAARFPADVARLSGADPQAFHSYAFTTLRQCGSCFELAAVYLRWLEERKRCGLGAAAEHFDRIASSAKSVQLSLARAVLRKRPISVEPALQSMALAWASAMELLAARQSS